jgi:hypothetical protein
VEGRERREGREMLFCACCQEGGGEGRREGGREESA